MAPMLSSQMTVKRIHREIADVAKEDLGSITLVPTPDNLFVWKGSIPGPQGSPYEGGVFGVDVVLGNDYPFSAPKVTFATRIYHMNISDRGNICIDILKHNWSPALSLFKVMLSLSSLLTDPNPHDPLVPNIATEFVRNRAQHDRTARQWTELYAKPKPPPPPPAPAPVASSSSSSTSTACALANGTTTSKSSKGKGKAPAPSPGSRNRSLQATSQTQPPTGTETITIDDSDDEFSTSTSRAGVSSSTNGNANGKGKKRKRELGVDGEVVDLTDEDAGAGAAGGRRNKRKSDGGGGVGRSTGERGDVIVIDD